MRLKFRISLSYSKPNRLKQEDSGHTLPLPSLQSAQPSSNRSTSRNPLKAQRLPGENEPKYCASTPVWLRKRNK